MDIDIFYITDNMDTCIFYKTDINTYNIIDIFDKTDMDIPNTVQIYKNDMDIFNKINTDIAIILSIKKY